VDETEQLFFSDEPLGQRLDDNANAMKFAFQSLNLRRQSRSRPPRHPDRGPGELTEVKWPHIMALLPYVGIIDEWSQRGKALVLQLCLNGW